MRRRLKYKELEGMTFAKLLESQKTTEEEGKQARNNISKLKKMKNVLEFKIATEASSLATEKQLVRKIDEVNKKLREEYKKIRIKRKSEFIKKDIEEYNKNIKDLSKEIDAYDKQLDELYDKIKSRLGIKKNYESEKKIQEKKRERNEAPAHQQHQQEVSLENIAVIKTVKKKKQDSEEE
ncbi:MAG: hypothetical protein ACP5LH_00375 [Candidatus Micrarchaeia archaeon]